MATPLETLKYHPDLQAQAVQLWIPYIDQAVNSLHYFKLNGRPGPDAPTVDVDVMRQAVNPFLDALASGWYAQQSGSLSAQGDVLVNAEAATRLASALGMDTDALLALLFQDVQDARLGQSPTGYLQAIDMWGSIPHDVVQSQWTTKVGDLPAPQTAPPSGTVKPAAKPSDTPPVVAQSGGSSGLGWLALIGGALLAKKLLLP